MANSGLKADCQQTTPVRTLEQRTVCCLKKRLTCIASREWMGKLAPMIALLLRRSACTHSERAEAFLRTRFAEVMVVSTDGPGTELGHLSDQPDALFAFRSHVIVRRAVLATVPLCINFHPGPPERRGSGCVNVAIASGDGTYGATCHHMDDQIDHGPIIDVRRFPINIKDSVRDVLARTYDNMLCQFYDVVDAVATRRPLSLTDANWSGPLGSAKEMNALRQIDLSPNARAHLERQIRATAFGAYQPFVTLHGKRFVLEATNGE